MPPSTSQSFARALGAVCAIASLPASAWQINYSLEMALGHSDNVNESAVDPIGQTMLIPRLDFDASEQGESVQARAVGQIEYRDYLEGGFDNELRGHLASVLDWIIVPHRFNFDFEDYAAVEPINILQPNSPSNLQQTNVFTLGPTFDFRLDPTLNGQAELRLSNSLASQTKEFDSNRGLAALRAIKDLSPTSKVSANIEAQKVHFTDRSGGPDYDRYDAFARYQSKLTDIDLDLAGGYSQVNYSGAGSHSGPAGRALVTWRATPRNTLTFGASRQYSDATQDLIIDPATLVSSSVGNAVVPGDTTITSQVFLERRFDAGYAFQAERWQLHVAPYYRKLQYLIDSTLDENARGATAGISYRPRPLWTIAFDVLEETRQFTSIARRDEDLRADLSFSDQLSRHWAVRADVIRNQRNSNVVDQGFRENIFFFTLIFRR
jgi:hypothetical protein